jgi:hypothetical protein
MLRAERVVAGIPASASSPAQSISQSILRPVPTFPGKQQPSLINTGCLVRIRRCNASADAQPIAIHVVYVLLHAAGDECCKATSRRWIG